MKSHQWDDIADASKDFFDSGAFMPETEIDEPSTDKHMNKRRLTELRRKTEERLDWKRMYGDMQFDDDGDESNLKDIYEVDYADDFEDIDEH